MAKKKPSGRYTPPKTRPRSETSWFRITSDDEDFLDLERIPVSLLQMVVPFVLRFGDGSVKGAGTAFCVAHLTTGHALFATARHVVEMLATHEQAEPLVLLPPPNLSRVDRDGFFGLHVGLVTMVESHSDDAILAVALDGTTAAPQALPLAFGRPDIGQLCLGVGFTRMDMGDLVGPDKHLWNYKLHTSRGPVEDIHPNGRYQRLSLPSMLVGARVPVPAPDQRLGTRDRSEDLRGNLTTRRLDRRTLTGLLRCPWPRATSGWRRHCRSSEASRTATRQVSDETDPLARWRAV
jgi:hypothetical protein